MTKIYIAGAGGMLGQAFNSVFGASADLKCTDIDVNETWLSKMDFRDLDAYRRDVGDFKPDLLFHLGAFTDLEYCEKNVVDTYATNTVSVENAVYIANKLDIPMLYISTAGIFDGAKDQYDDWDVPNPLGHYARSKYAAEVYVTKHARRYIVCRAGWMMGGGPSKDKKFVQKLMSQIKDGKRELNIVTDKMGTPTYTFDFAYTVRTLFDQELWGLYNAVCQGVTSRLEVANELVSELNLSDKIKINEVTSDFFSGTYFAPRPESERLINRKLDIRGITTMRPWKVGLHEYLHDSYGSYL